MFIDINSYKWHFYMNWYPQALLTAEQACRRRFLLLKHNAPFFQTCPFLTETCIFVYICSLCLFLKTPNRRETQRHSKWRLDFVLSSHIDPIGDQNDVQYLSIYWVYLVYLVLSTRLGTRYIRTYCTYVHTVQYILYILYILYSTYCTYCTYRTVPYRTVTSGTRY